MCKFFDHLKRFIPLLRSNIKCAWENSRPSYQEAWKGAFLPITISDLSGLANAFKKTIQVRKVQKKRRSKHVNKKAKSKRKARNK